MSEHPYRRLSPLTPVARSGILIVAVLAATWRDLLRGDLGPFGWLLLGLLIVGGIYGGTSWLRTKYWIESDELRVDTGVINRQSRRIRIDRLQGVDIVQPFVARLFGLAELRMDVAGGSAREGSLAFLTLNDARELKDLLLARRDAVRAGSSSPPSALGTSAPGPDGAGADSGDAAPGLVPAAPSPEPDRLLARVDLQLLLLSTLLTPEAISLGVVAVFFGVLPLFVDDAGGVSVALPVLGGLALVVIRKFAAGYGFTVAQTAAGLQVRRGLFELSSQTIALSRLQGVVVSEPLLWRKLGWARLDVAIAGYAASSDDNGGPSASTVLPVGARTVVKRLAHHMLNASPDSEHREVDLDQTALTPPPPRARWVSPVGRRFMAAGTSEALVVSREGWFNRRTHIVPHARVQSLRVTQGPVQRLLGLADVHVDSPPGPVKVRARDRLAGEARAMLEREIMVSRQARAPRTAEPLIRSPAGP
ncbi:MAG TPA: PH domain-containing protein [Nocardioidaceae bacterium]|nr:PH domain-containing protein [Nocardioidaceae bacterium]